MDLGGLEAAGLPCPTQQANEVIQIAWLAARSAPLPAFPDFHAMWEPERWSALEGYFSPSAAGEGWPRFGKGFCAFFC